MSGYSLSLKPFEGPAFYPCLPDKVLHLSPRQTQSFPSITPLQECIEIFDASSVPFLLTPSPQHPPTELLFTPQHPSLSQPRQREAQEKGPSPLGSHWPLLRHGAWQAATECLTSPPRPGSAHCQQHPYLPEGRGAVGVTRHAPTHPTSLG